MDITYSQYKAKAYKGTPQVYFDYFYRAISHPVTYVLLRLGFTPNAMTYGSILWALAGGVVVISGYPVYGMLTFMISYLLDFCDGNAARVVIKTQGMDEKLQKRGNIFENLNTNVALLSLYGSIGYYLSQAGADERLLVFAFMIFGVKMISRYTVRHAYDIFQESASSLAPGPAFMERYRGSLFVKVKFFLTKSFFAANFYYVLYLLAFGLFAPWAWLALVVYGGLDVLMSLARMFKAIYR